MSVYNYDKFFVALRNRRTEIRVDIKRTERQLADLHAELADVQTGIDEVERELLKRNEL